MNREIELAYLGIEVPDPSSLDGFFGEVVGLVPGDRPHSWRNDGKVRRIVVEAGPRNDAAYLGFEATDTAAFERVAGRIGAVEVDGADRGVERLACVATPWGTDVEVVLGLGDAPAPFDSSLVPGGFHTEGVGFGHAVFATTAFDESHRFLTDGLGLGQSDFLLMELAPGLELEVRFYHCNERHHTVALAKAPFDLPQTLHHLMLETRERDDVGAAFDRAWATDLGIPNGLGKHDNDGMFSFYVQTPAGFQVEIGHGAKVVGDDWDGNRRYDRISAWGHQPLRSAPT